MTGSLMLKRPGRMAILATVLLVLDLENRKVSSRSMSVQPEPPMRAKLLMICMFM